jgi:hypothetical protein
MIVKTINLRSESNQVILIPWSPVRINTTTNNQQQRQHLLLLYTVATDMVLPQSRLCNHLYYLMVPIIFKKN